MDKSGFAAVLRRRRHGMVKNRVAQIPSGVAGEVGRQSKVMQAVYDVPRWDGNGVAIRALSG